MGAAAQGASATTGSSPPRSATRCPSGPTSRSYSRTWVLRECDASLTRLATDHIDIYYLHRDYNGMDLEEPLRAIERCCAPARSATGACPTSAAGASPKLVHTARALNMPAPVVCQPYYNLLNRQPEVEILPACDALRHRRGAVQPDRARRAHRQVRARRKPAEGTRAGRGDKRIMETEFREESLRSRADARGALRHAKASRCRISPPHGCWRTAQ